MLETSYSRRHVQRTLRGLLEDGLAAEQVTPTENYYTSRTPE